ncbi:hypothetical protein JRX38_14175 [Gluconobacter cerinus]|uniref:hypothetical protein n=1 Tax=Gluconobacter cerinus TaxID=38307 RepID=UPI00193FD6A5|nr:hypothetical protein [Gluconobacter cerinus]MBM3099134.1 hypothetical protein [Gluconobacter cerinus]
MATTQIDLCNRALRRLGTQSTITSLTDGSVEADTCAAFYDDVLESLLENPQCSAYPSYSWQWPRRVASGSSGTSNNPRWKYEYQLPTDCMSVSGIIDPNAPNGWWLKPERMFLLPTPYEIGAGGPDDAPVSVIWCDSGTIDLLYVSNGISIDNWPANFRRAFWLTLAGEMGTGLGVSGSILSSIASEADRVLGQACQADQRVEVVSTEYIPDWMMARGLPLAHDHRASQTLETYPSGYIVGDASANVPTPNYLVPSTGANGVSALGLQPRDIGDRGNIYIPADTPDSRIGVLAIGDSPIAWRRPYHNQIILGEEPGEGETEV